MWVLSVAISCAKAHSPDSKAAECTRRAVWDELGGAPVDLGGGLSFTRSRCCARQPAGHCATTERATRKHLHGFNGTARCCAALMSALTVFLDTAPW